MAHYQPMTPSKTPKPKADTGTVLHLKFDGEMLAGLAALAAKMSKETGVPVTQAALIRKAVNDLLAKAK